VRLTDAQKHARAAAAILAAHPFTPLAPSGNGHGAPQDIPPLPPDPGTPAPGPLTGAWWDQRPALATIRDFAYARMVSPAALLGAVIVRAVAATPWRVVLPGPGQGSGISSLNLFVALVGPSGGGKSLALDAAADLLPAEVPTIQIGSGEGISSIFGESVQDGLKWTTREAIAEIPEVDTLKALASRQGSTVVAELRKGWTGEALGQFNRDKTRRVIIPKHEYRLCVVMGVQPGKADWLLSDAAGGTPQRFLYMPAQDASIPFDPPPEPAPLKLPTPQWPESHWRDRPRMEVCPEARLELRQLLHAKNQPGYSGPDLDSHAGLLHLKVAAALAVISGDPTVITSDDWELARDVMCVSAATRQSMIDAGRASRAATNRARGDQEAERAELVQERLDRRDIERVCAGILRKIGRDGPCSRRMLRQNAGRDGRCVDEALALLEDRGQVLVSDGLYKTA